MDLPKIRDWVDLILKCLSIVAIVVAGWWALYQFRLTETAAYNVQIAVSAESQAYGNDLRLLLIHVRPKNIGKVLVTPGKLGLVVTVRSIPERLKSGVVDLEELPVFYTGDLMNRFPDGYDLEPGVEYDEVLALIVPKGKMFSIKAILDLGDDTEVDHTTVTRVE
jgi:hypothetical protein